MVAVADAAAGAALAALRADRLSGAQSERVRRSLPSWLRSTRSLERFRNEVRNKSSRTKWNDHRPTFIRVRDDETYAITGKAYMCFRTVTFTVSESYQQIHGAWSLQKVQQIGNA